MYLRNFLFLIIQALLTAWLSSKVTDLDMWQDLQRCIEGCMQNHVEVVYQIRVKESLLWYLTFAV